MIFRTLCAIVLLLPSSLRCQEFRIANSETYLAGPANSSFVDVDSSGTLDLVQPIGTSYSWFPNAAIIQGPLGTPIPLPVSSLTIPPVIDDLNGDGLKDIAFVATQGFVNSQVVVRFGQIGGTFGTPIVVTSGSGAVLHLVSGDFDDDGLGDLGISGFNLSRIFLQRPTAWLLAGTVATAPSRLTAGDFDGDGDDDLFVVAFQGAFILLGNPSGVGSAPVGIPFPTFTGNFTQPAVDLNGDGLKDVTIDIDVFNFGTLASNFLRYENLAIDGPPCTPPSGPLTSSIGSAVPGNPAFTVQLGNAAPGLPCELLISLQATQSAVCAPLIDLDPSSLLSPLSGYFTSLTTSATGSASQTFSIPASVSSAPSIYFQWGVLDPAGPLSYSGFTFATSPARALRFF